MRRLRQRCFDGTLVGDAAALVIADRERSIDRLPLEIDPADGKMKPAINRMPKRWHDQHSGPPKRRHRAAAPWRDVTPRLRCEFAHYDLYRRGDVYAMSVNLGPKIERAALAEGRGAKRYLAARIAHHLGSALGRTCQFWFVLEQTDGRVRRLHLHGALSCDANEENAVRAALQAAAGKWSASCGQYQVHLEPNPDNYWVTYAFKDCPMRKANKPSSWRDDPFMTTRDLKRGAGDLYNEIQKQVELTGLGLHSGVFSRTH
jgi:hypothetical protein